MRVVNASPLIHLARVSLLDVLREPRESVEVVVPDVVFAEVMTGLIRDRSAMLVEEATFDWLTIVPTPDPHPNIDQRRIDAGEIAVISFAMSKPGSIAVLDDRLAREQATNLGIPVIGTIRLLIDAKQRGIIPSVRDPLESLRAQGMRLSDELFTRVIRQAGE
jgi:predicted nucleic acid-binding protein